ncbi:hypothetical protein [Cellulomonas sp.]|nr:hypothetical protein [Cellulomonas sp.]
MNEDRRRDADTQDEARGASMRHEPAGTEVADVACSGDPRRRTAA